MNRKPRHTSLIVRLVIVGTALAVAAWQSNGGRSKAALAMPIVLPKIPVVTVRAELQRRSDQRAAGARDSRAAFSARAAAFIFNVQGPYARCDER